MSSVAATKTDRLRLDYDSVVDSFTFTIYAANGRSGPSHGHRSFLSSLPERTSLTGRAGPSFMVPAIDVAVDLIYEHFGSGNVDFATENARTAYNVLLLSLRNQDAVATAFARYKAHGEIPKH